MISDLLFSRTTMPDLEKSMDAYSLRQKALANNIANAMTPGYRAQKVSFEEEYKNSLDPNQLRGKRTNENHIPINNMTLSEVQPRLELKESPMNDTGLNNVDIDKEMAEMAENALRYEMSTKLYFKKISNTRKAISGR